MMSLSKKIFSAVLGLIVCSSLLMQASACSHVEEIRSNDIFARDDQGNTSFHRIFGSSNQEDSPMTLMDWFATNVSNTTLQNLKGETPLDVAIKHNALAAVCAICEHELSLTSNPIVKKGMFNLTAMSGDFRRYLRRLVRDLSRQKFLTKLPKILPELQGLLEPVFVKDSEGNMPLHGAVKEKDYAKQEEILKRCTYRGFRFVKIDDMTNLLGRTPLDLAVDLKDQRSIHIICFHELFTGGNNFPSQQRTFERLFERAVLQKNYACLKALLVGISDTLYTKLDLGIAYVNNDTHFRKNPQYSALHLAASGDPERLRELLQSGASPTRYRDYRYTPLHAAAHAGDARCIAVLVQHGADVNFQDAAWNSPLHLLLSRFNDMLERPELKDEEKEMLYYNAAAVLMAHGASIELEDEDKVTPLFALSEGGWSDVKSKIIKLFLASLPRGFASRRLILIPSTIPKGAYQKFAETLEKLNFTVSLQTQKAYFSAMNDFDTILKAVQVGEIDDMVTAPASSSSTETEPEEIDESTLRMVVAHSKEINVRTKEGSTLLHQAMKRGHIPWVELLLSHGAYPTVADSAQRDTPLHIAANLRTSSVRQRLIAMLLRAGASANVQNRERETPLCVVAGMYDAQSVQMLIEAGALVNSAGTGFKTALHELFEEFNGHTPDTRERQKQVLMLLLQAGASVLQDDANNVSPLEVLLNGQYFDEYDVQLVNLIVASSLLRDRHYRAEFSYHINACATNSPLKRVALERLKTILPT